MKERILDDDLDSYRLHRRVVISNAFDRSYMVFSSFSYSWFICRNFLVILLTRRNHDGLAGYPTSVLECKCLILIWKHKKFQFLLISGGFIWLLFWSGSAS